jgi:NTP pyrophosphatase (non-canonical NTP hydrolase)
LTSTSLSMRVAEWHSQRFPTAEASDVLIKGMEEYGEIAEALAAEVGRNSAKSPEGLSVPKESADVIICLMALVYRYYGVDVLDEVEAKLEDLVTPGKHRSSLLE